MRKTLVLAPEAHNLAEVTRMIEIGKVAREHFDILFLSYDGGGRNHRFIEAEGFAIRRMEPQLTEAQIQQWWKVDRGEAFDAMLTEADIRLRVANEIRLFQEIQPAAVLTGFCLSIPISARVAGIPLVWVSQSTWLSEYADRFGTWPDAADYRLLRLLPQSLLDGASRRLNGFFSWLLNKNFNGVAKAYGLPPFRGSSLVEGDYNLFAEPPSFSGLDIPARLAGRYRFVGPIVGRLDLPIPQAILDMPRDLPIVYFAMGSSGVDQVVAQILEGFRGCPYRVIAPVAPLVSRLAITPPPNVIVTDWLPAHLVNPIAHVSVIHGGIGTVMTACLSGTPLVGIPNGNPEQEWNVECVVRKGFGVHLKKRRLRATDVIEAVDRFLHDEKAQAQAKAFQAELQKWDGPANAAAFLKETF